jgi:hypothetical protein
MGELSSIRVTSNVGRDVLAAATSFKTEAATVWEYVVNSIQYVGDGILPKVEVLVKPRARSIEIRDNGRGMSASGLMQFFTMHGENIDRLRGRPGRGKFGTGKSAAFGIGTKLCVDTRRDGLRNRVELDRGMIEASKGEEIDLLWPVKNEPTELPSGTTISIEGIVLPKLNASAIVEYIERHLLGFRGRMPEVAVNEHLCEYREPSVVETFTFCPSPAQAEVLGAVELAVKVSQSPLPPLEQGVAVLAGVGNLVAIETGGIENKEFGNYLFGEIDVPALEAGQSPIEPYDTSRSLRLNPQHPVAGVLLPFIGSKLEEVRKKQLEKLRSAQKTEEARRLLTEAQRIADVLNDDFRTMVGRLQGIRSALARPGDASSRFGSSLGGSEEEGVWVEGTTRPGTLEKQTGRGEDEPGPGPGPQPGPDPQIGKAGHPDADGDAAVDPTSREGHKRKRPRGGFSVEFRNLGADNDRSVYDPTSLSILINLDHPVVKSARRDDGIADPSFRRLANEIAFAEYAIALGYEQAERDTEIPADDLLFEIRSTLNRVSTRAADLYR